MDFILNYKEFICSMVFIFSINFPLFFIIFQYVMNINMKLRNKKILCFEPILKRNKDEKNCNY